MNRSSLYDGKSSWGLFQAHKLIVLNAFLGHVHFIKTANSQPSQKRKCWRSLASLWVRKRLRAKGEGLSTPLLSLVSNGPAPSQRQVLTQAYRMCLDAALFFFPLCTVCVVLVTKATWCWNRENTWKFLPVARQSQWFGVFEVCIPCWFPNHVLFSKPNTIAWWILISFWKALSVTS